MTGQRQPWVSVVMVVAALLLVAAHITVLRVAASSAALPVSIAFGVIAVVVITHRRLLDSLRGWLRRRPQHPPESR